jgi:hypothetical protein
MNKIDPELGVVEFNQNSDTVLTHSGRQLSLSPRVIKNHGGHAENGG